MMNQKTIKLNNDYKIVDDVVYVLVDVSEYPSESNPFPKYNFEWKKSKYQIGSDVVLVSQTDVSPNSIRSGCNTPKYKLSFNIDGIGGNSDNSIKQYHGWRGTTNDISIEAHGLRKITKIKKLKNGQISVTVGKVLEPDLK